MIVSRAYFQQRNTPKKKKEKPPPPKLAYHMTQEELEESVCQHVRDHFAPKKPPTVHQWSEKDKKYFRTLLQPKYRAPLSDYDCQITKSWEKPSNRRRNQVSQLRQQSKQSIPPLKVLSD